MELIVVGSGSSGNSYILKSERQVLLIEAGVPFKEVMKHLDFKVDNIVGCLISHKHGDHNGYSKQFNEHGVNIIRGETLRADFLDPSPSFMVGEFEVMPLEVQHDVKCFSFLIHHPECGLIYFVTDTHYIKYNPKGLNHIIIECNYSEEILEENTVNSNVNPFVRNRVLESHMSLETVNKWLSKIDISGIQNIVLTHLSNSNASGDKFKNEVIKATGKLTNIAVPGLKVNLNKTPF